MVKIWRKTTNNPGRIRRRIMKMRRIAVKRLRINFSINFQILTTDLQQQHAGRIVNGKMRIPKKIPTKYIKIPNKRRTRAGMKIQESKEDKK